MANDFIKLIPWTNVRIIIAKYRSDIDLSGLPMWLSGKEPACQYRRHKRLSFYLWIRRIPWRRAWQPTPVFLPGESHGQRSLGATIHRIAKSQTQLKRLSTHAQFPIRRHCIKLLKSGKREGAGSCERNWFGAPLTATALRLLALMFILGWTGFRWLYLFNATLTPLSLPTVHTRKLFEIQILAIIPAPERVWQ